MGCWLLLLNQHPYHLHSITAYNVLDTPFTIYIYVHISSAQVIFSDIFINYLTEGANRPFDVQKQCSKTENITVISSQNITQWYHHCPKGRLWKMIWCLTTIFSPRSHRAGCRCSKSDCNGWSHLMQLSKEGACKSGYPTHTTYCQVSWGIRLGACGVSSCLSWARSPRCMQCSTPLGETEEVSSRWRSESRIGTLRSLCRLPVDSCPRIRFPSWWSRQVATDRLFPEKKEFKWVGWWV